jgi:hypothetical protein
MRLTIGKRGAVLLAILGLSGAAIATASATVASTSPSNYNPLAPTRVLDTRSGVGAAKAPVPAGGSITINVDTAAGVTGLTAATLNLTVTDTTANGYLTVDPGPSKTPTGTSNLNFSAGQTLANEVTSQVSADGEVTIWNRSTGTVELVADLEGYYSASAAPYIPPMTTWSATSTVADHPDSGDGGTWAVDTIARTAAITLKGAASVYHCGSGATSCYLYEGTISDTGSFTTASSKDVTTDGLSPNKGVKINATVTGTLVGGSAIQFYASSDTPSASGVPALVSGPVSGEQTTTDWVEQFFPAGTVFGSGPDLLNWNWTYSAPNTCEQWVDAASGETGDIAGVNACGS